MGNQAGALEVENRKLRQVVGELQSRIVDLEHKKTSINYIVNLVQGGKVSVKGEKESDVGLSIKKMAEPLYDWLRKEPVKLDLV